jgi:Zn finger protein HypA/HybF involved in hydrogenase expression
MALFDDLKKKVTDTTQGAVRGAKDFADTSRLNSLINDEQKQITNLYVQIGKYVYEHRTETEDTVLKELLNAVTSANSRIATHQAEIQQIKGVKLCPNCGKEIPMASAFCGNCGASVATVAAPESVAPDGQGAVCANCGAAVAQGVAFCQNCGQKI